MFYLRYVLSELRRRRARTILTALGLAVGVGLVVMVSGLTTGLDNAQAKVLEPLTGVGTDMSVTRPLKLPSSGTGGGFASLTPAQRTQLRGEVGAGPGIDFRSLKPGSKIATTTFRAAGDLTFPSSELQKLSRVSGVQSVAGSLTLTELRISGTVPKIKVRQSASSSGSFRSGAGGFGRASGSFGGGSLNSSSVTITGVDQDKAALAAVTPSQIVKGHYFTTAGSSYQAIVSTGYADSADLSVGSELTIGKQTFDVVGISSAPLGGTASDVYVKLATLQKVSGGSGQIDTAEVAAASAGEVSTVSAAISKDFTGSQVTTAADLAARVTGSLTDAKNLSHSLGGALEIVGLVAAILIATLLTLASIARRVREIGTLKAVGWSRAQVVRQICAEALGHGVLGAVAGVVLGLAGILVLNAVGWTLNAAVAAPTSGAAGGPFGLGQLATTAGSTAVKITAVAGPGLIVAAVGLALIGGLLAGAIGSLRAARLRPAAALRTVE